MGGPTPSLGPVLKDCSDFSTPGKGVLGRRQAEGQKCCFVAWRWIFLRAEKERVVADGSVSSSLAEPSKL